jgi:protein arginine N-methyltransferase 2
MAYINETLTFEADKIYYSLGNETLEVMMDWESSIMKASADYVCSNGGDILELGFGMGISAGYIQANSINSHTIVECHPQILEKARAWAKDKPNVSIVEGEWFNIKDSLSTYDGVFYDTYGEEDWSKFGDSIASLTKSGAKVTWWNNNPSATTIHDIDGVTYDVIDVDPPSNNYFNSSKYYLPKKEY